MRLGMNRRIKIRIFPAYTKPIWQNVNKALVVLLVITTFSMGGAYYYTKICPAITELARQRMSQMLTTFIEQSVNEYIGDGNFEYENIVSVQKNESGEIQALFLNTKQINQIKSDIALVVHEKIESADYADLKVPIGAVMFGGLFSSFGPSMKVTLLSMGYADVDFDSSFSSAGINQTKHQIDISVDANFAMVTSAGSENVSISTTVPIAQTIIVGNVPEMHVEK